jgi:hypothetical protein
VLARPLLGTTYRLCEVAALGTDALTSATPPTPHPDPLPTGRGDALLLIGPFESLRVGLRALCVFAVRRYRFPLTLVRVFFCGDFIQVTAPTRGCRDSHVAVF